MAALRYSHVSKLYDKAGRAAVDDVSLEIGEAQFVVLIGPSGCGKTTLLKMTNRLIEPSDGTIDVNGRDVTAVPVTELRRHMGYVIQQVGLFPHINVAANVATVPRLLGWPKSRIQDRVDELLQLVGLEPSQYRGRYPGQLSGGQQQRVGLARALAADPGILLMDEPFGAIDAITRTRLQDELVQIQRRVRKTVVFVTHDVDEALRLADKLVVMRDGKVVQYDSPFETMTKPADDFVRELLNTDDVLRELSLITVGSAMQPPGSLNQRPSVSVDQSLRQALSVMISTGRTELSAVDATGSVVGSVSMPQIQACGARGSKASPAQAEAVVA